MDFCINGGLGPWYMESINDESRSREFTTLPRCQSWKGESGAVRGRLFQKTRRLTGGRATGAKQGHTGR